MEKRKSISYIIPAYNCGRCINAAIASIVNGNLESGDEIIVVNDASTDNTRAVVSKLAARISQLKCIHHPYNKGCAAGGRNTGIQAARNELLFALDADNVLVQQSIDRLVNYMTSQHADAAAFREVRFFVDDPARPTHSWFYNANITLADALSGHYWPGPDGNYLFTKESWLRAGRYDEFVGGGVDSWAFGVRQLATGTRMVTLDESHYLHRWGHDSAWMQDARVGSQSIKACRALLPFIDLIEDESIDYILARDTRRTWFENLPTRPLRVRQGKSGIDGGVIFGVRKDRFITRVRRYVARRIWSG